MIFSFYAIIVVMETQLGSVFVSLMEFAEVRLNQIYLKIVIVEAPSLYPDTHTFFVVRFCPGEE